MKATARRSGRGGFAIGLIVGVLIGLAIALGVALYVSKVPVPFVNKVPQRTAEQDAQEAERNKNWDPNAPLAGKAPQRPAPAAPAPPVPLPPATGVAPAVTAAVPPGRPASAAPATGAAMMYFAQAGAYTRSDDAEAQRAKLALLGLDAKISEREQAGRTVYRVRVGPFDSKAEADGAIERLQSAGVDSALVRVQRQ